MIKAYRNSAVPRVNVIQTGTRLSAGVASEPFAASNSELDGHFANLRRENFPMSVILVFNLIYDNIIYIYYIYTPRRLVSRTVRTS